MLVRRLSDCDEFVAGDGSILREFLHPDKAGAAVGYSLARATVPAGRETVPHRLRTAEVYYILRGRGRMHINAESAPVEADCMVYIPPGSTQQIRNTGTDDLVFLCIVDPAWQPDDEEIVGS